ncbi:hypothetical protein Taro_017773 [Colocasia esculenta]|uniref:Major facilitator superfamily (MFS) profile domain-containing protein n=1 Tax=Colocasia esculenta TaxID=4460 RepID=A0A843V0E8_COLES|nr:hypothetical protein [Colocasia esculenta]
MTALPRCFPIRSALSSHPLLLSSLNSTLDLVISPLSEWLFPRPPSQIMAAGFAQESGTARCDGRVTSLVVFSCIMAAMGGVIFGYDIGISGGVTSMESFLEKFFPEVHAQMKGDSHISNYCKFDSQLLTAFTSSLYIAGLFASFFAASVTRAWGRRASILVGGAAFLAGAALGGAAANVYMLILGRILLGVGIGFANQVRTPPVNSRGRAGVLLSLSLSLSHTHTHTYFFSCLFWSQSVPLYLSEMAPSRFRGAFSNGFQFSVGIGALSANLINYGTEKITGGWGWRVSLSLAAVPASILTLGALFLPETPSSLVRIGSASDVHRAKVMLQRIRGIADVQAELDDLVAAGETARAVRHPFRTILRRKYRPQLVMAVTIPFFQQVTGINVIAFYAPLLFRTMGLGESASLLSVVLVTGVVGTSSTLLSMVAVDKLGRRFLFLMGGLQMLVSQTLVGAVLAAQLGDHGSMSKGYAALVMALICVYVAGFGWSWGPLGWLVPSEIFPLEIRPAGQSIVVAVSFLFTSVVAQAFLSMLCHMRWGIFFFFGAWVVVMTGFVHLLLPETKNTPIEQMERVWAEHWFWKRVVGEEEKNEKNRVQLTKP